MLMRAKGFAYSMTVHSSPMLKLTQVIATNLDANFQYFRLNTVRDDKDD